MAKRFSNTAVFFSLFVMFIALVTTFGCGQDQTPSSQQQTPAATAPAPVATAPPAPVAPAAPPAASPQSAIPSAPSPTAMPAQSVAPPAATAPGPQNSAQVQMGMTSQQVLQLMGNPGKIEQEKGMIEWKYYTPQGKFEIYFQNDRVARISTH